MKIVKWIIRVFASLLITLALLFILIELFVGRPLDDVNLYLKSSEFVDVIDDKWLVFKPANKKVEAGFILYPGAFVDSEAYARLASSLANNGILSIIVTFPFRIALMNTDEADDVIIAFPEVKKWFICGHSLGGVAASFYLRESKNPDWIFGAIMLGSYLPDKYRVGNISLPVLSIYGSNEGRAYIYEPTRCNLSVNTRLHRIEGGNHSQFGYYGFHFLSENTAAISRDEQQAITETQTLNFIKSVLKK